MPAYQARNGRIIARGSGGQFRRFTLRDLGVADSELQKGEATCAKCGHKWWPILKVGRCPECGSEDKTT